MKVAAVEEGAQEREFFFTRCDCESEFFMRRDCGKTPTLLTQTPHW